MQLSKTEVQDVDGTATNPWGTFKVRLGTSGRWRLGPCCIWIKRSPKEWLLAVESGRDYLSTESEVAIPVQDDDWPEQSGAEYSRYAFSETRNHITLWPELSPISVVFSPETPVLVAPGEHVTLYVSTPLWVRLETGDPITLLKEFPAFRPSDTWFGPNTREGEHCYAVKMAGRLHLDDLPTRVHRAITPIQIRNKAKENLNVQQVRLPVQLLSLYRAADGMLWTQPVVLESEHDRTGAVLHLKERFGTLVEDMQLMRPPREELEGNIVSRAWHWFFRK
jgi:hypothetical protein